MEKVCGNHSANLPFSTNVDLVAVDGGRPFPRKVNGLLRTYFPTILNAQLLFVVDGLGHEQCKLQATQITIKRRGSSEPIYTPIKLLHLKGT
ncbi:hypothetical protein VTI28DRAFT_9651 [Corynascus sepedonium]